MKGYQGLLHAYKEYLPVNTRTPMLSLLEGHTPLIPLPYFSEEWGITLHAKYEGANPTGSFKDRGMVLAVAKAVEEGSDTIICASTGNTSAAAAAYAARANLRCIVVIPNGKIARGKLAQAVMYGAEIISIDGNFDQALQIVKKVSSKENVTLVNSINPYRIEGQKTSAFEICDELGMSPDIVALPVGNAGNITAYWKGFKEYHFEKETGLPKMFGFQAAGAAPIVNNGPVSHPETIATAIRIGNPASWEGAKSALEQSKGEIHAVTDEEIVEGYKLLARHEGVFAEPASCASFAGIKKLSEQGKLPKGIKIVLILTGNGLKDPETAVVEGGVTSAILPNDEEAVTEFIRGRGKVRI
ncbi:threonine synthase [Bacillus coahuilensis]|uniref:threonine synthase n=1 Tax=Bacillus coahuilensis TaxID=408580 RepID=UPI0001850F7B|nr:threonine synthase [Bacillus coahuilensis]